MVDLLSGTGTGALWAMAGSDLNATLLAWPPGHEVAEHANTEVDVLLVVLGGGVWSWSTSGNTCSLPAMYC